MHCAKIGWNWPSGSWEEDNEFLLFHNYLLLEKGGAPSFEQTWILFTQQCIVPSIVENKIFNFYECIFAILVSSPLGKGHGPSFEQTWIPFAQGCIVPWNWPSGSGEQDFNISSMYFHYFVNSSPWKRVRPLIHLDKLESLYHRMICAKFGWDRSSGSGEEDENVKSLGQCQLHCTMTDNGKFCVEKLTRALQLRWAKPVWMKPL